MSLDHATARDAFAGPGQDTRQWVSFATVDPDTPGARAVRFKDSDGNPLPLAPMVDVTLQPSGIPVPCRVASGVAGNGEGDWYPFLAGDEVIVLIPEGDERAGCTIIGRLNQEIDVWPQIVAGQDATTNTFGFRRMRTPFIVETASSYLIRSATTGAQFGIDQQGQVIFNGGDGGQFFLGADAIGFTSPDGDTSVQMLVGSQQIALTAGGTANLLLDAAASSFITSGTFTIGTSGSGGTGHAVTLEQLTSILANLIVALASPPALAFSPTSPLVLTPAPPLIDAILTFALAGASLPSPFAFPGVGGGIVATLPLTFAPVAGAISLGLALPAPQIDPTGFYPGIGRPGLKF